MEKFFYNFFAAFFIGYYLYLFTYAHEYRRVLLREIHQVKTHKTVMFLVFNIMFILYSLTGLYTNFTLFTSLFFVAIIGRILTLKVLNDRFQSLFMIRLTAIIILFGLARFVFLPIYHQYTKLF